LDKKIIIIEHTSLIYVFAFTDAALVWFFTVKITDLFGLQTEDTCIYFHRIFFFL